MFWILVVIALISYIIISLILSSGIREIVERKSVKVEIKETPPYYVLAYLSGGIRNTVFSIFYRLQQEGIIEFTKDLTRISKIHAPKINGLSKFEQDFCSTVGESQEISSSLSKENLTRLKPLIDSDPFLLTHPELIFTHQERELRNERSQQGTLIALFLLIGIVVGFFSLGSFSLFGAFAMTIPFAVVLYIIHWVFFKFPSNTYAGESFKYHHYTLNPKPGSSNVTAIPLIQRITLISIYGPEIFPLLGWSDFKDHYVRKDYSSSSSSGSGCGTSCSSSSCGSSCSSGGGDGGSCGGGCGGCGGGD